MSTHVTPEAEYRENLTHAHFIAALLREAPLEELLSAIALAEATGHQSSIPPSSANTAAAWSEDKRVLEILAHAQRELARLPGHEVIDDMPILQEGSPLPHAET
jgi:hypothetical protein